MSLMVPDSIQAANTLQEESLPHRFSLEEYLHLSEIGFFADKRVELIDGEIIDMASQKDPHAFAVSMATRWCDRSFSESEYWVRSQATLVTRGSSPEPDIAIMDYPPTPAGQYASADRAVLVIEIADSTLLLDTTTKMSLYASAGVKDYWVVSIPDRQIIVHRQPTSAADARFKFGYGDVRRCGVGQLVSPLAIPGATLDPQLLFG